MADISAKALRELQGALDKRIGQKAPTTATTQTATVTGAKDGDLWVTVDGATTPTPASSSVCAVSVGDRVTTVTSDGALTITGNVTAPATSQSAVDSTVAPVADTASEALTSAVEALTAAVTAKQAAEAATSDAATAKAKAEEATTDAATAKAKATEAATSAATASTKATEAASSASNAEASATSASKSATSAASDAASAKASAESAVSDASTAGIAASRAQAAAEAAETASSEAKTKADSAATDASTAATKATEAAASAAKTATKITTEYATGTSQTTAPTSGWSSKTPTYVAGTYTWMHNVVTYGDGSTATTSPVLVTGNTGAGFQWNLVSGTSAEWSDWITPKYNTKNVSGTLYVMTLPRFEVPQSFACQIEFEFSGVTVTENQDIRMQMQGAVNGSWTLWYRYTPWNNIVFKRVPADGVYSYTWSKTMSAVPDSDISTYSLSYNYDYWASGKFRYRCVKIEYGDTATPWCTTQAETIGAKGEKGETGEPGADGASVSTVAVQYASGTSKTTAPTDGWQSDVPELAEGSYVWIRSVTTITAADGTESTDYGTPALYLALDGLASDVRTAQSTADTAKTTADAAATDVADTREWFWHDSQGAHVCNGTKDGASVSNSRFQTDITSTGLQVVDTTGGYGTVASFGVDGDGVAQCLLGGGDSNVLVNNERMDVITPRFEYVTEIYSAYGDAPTEERSSGVSVSWVAPESGAAKDLTLTRLSSADEDTGLWAAWSMEEFLRPFQIDGEAITAKITLQSTSTSGCLYLDDGIKPYWDDGYDGWVDSAELLSTLEVSSGTSSWETLKELYVMVRLVDASSITFTVGVTATKASRLDGTWTSATFGKQVKLGYDGKMYAAEITPGKEFHLAIDSDMSTAIQGTSSKIAIGSDPEYLAMGGGVSDLNEGNGTSLDSQDFCLSTLREKTPYETIRCYTNDSGSVIASIGYDADKLELWNIYKPDDSSTSLPVLGHGSYAIVSNLAADDTATKTVTVSKSGYTPIGVIGWYFPGSTYANSVASQCWLTDRTVGTGIVHFSVRNMATKANTIKGYVYVLWAKCRG